MRGHIVVVGSLNMDLVVRTPRHPKIGETIIGSEFRTFPGGKGANQAVAAAKLGSPVMMIGRVGDDDFGYKLIEAVSVENMEVTYIIRDDCEPTGVAFITVDELGQNSIVVASGANAHLSPEDIDSAEAAFVGASVLLLQLECPLLAVNRAIELARQHGLMVVLNPAPAQVLDADLLASVDYLIPNESELALLSGQDDIQAAVRVIQDHGVKRMVVTLGDKGCLLVDNDTQKYLPAYNVPIVDTTAAGDAFAGAFAVGIKEGISFTEAANWGRVAGALTVTRAGAQPSLPTRTEFDEFRQTHGDGS